MTTGSPPPGHLPDGILAGYVDAALSPADRAAADAHLAECAACRAELVAASRLAMEAPPARRRSLAPLSLVATAAALVILIAERDHTAGTDALRSGSGDAAARSDLIVVSPAPTDTVSPTRIRFAWRPSPGVIEYTISVQDGDGRVRWSATTSDSTLTLPDSVTVMPGGTLHWYVDGLRADGRSIGTGRHQVTIR